MTYVTDLDTTDRNHADDVGGKGANLGELMRIDGVRVPAGFCVTTAAFDRTVPPALADRFDALARLDPDDRDALRAAGEQVRRAIEDAPVPDDVLTALDDALRRFDPATTFAVRSSAQAEDLPGASFAGQHDSFLDVDAAAVLQHVRRCWASAFSERAMTYRRRSGLADRDVRMAVVVQRMAAARVAGVLFTADPLTSHRRIAVIEAVHGLGEALVSGRVTGDVYRVGPGDTLEATPADPGRPALTDGEVRGLVRLGRRIEAHFGRPQDIEWCLVGDDVEIVQSRPITTLFPVPDRDDDATHVYVSVGHQQMMTDPFTPLGLSFWQLTTPARMAEAGGRLFVDVTSRLAVPATRAALLDLIGKSDPLVVDALRTLIDRDGCLREQPDDEAAAPPVAAPPPAPLETDPSVVTDLITRTEESVAAAARAIAATSGPEVFEFIRTDLQELRHYLFNPLGHQVYMSAMEASWWLNEHVQQWLGVPNVADTLTQSVPHNVTSEMGLALLDVADVVRAHPQVVAFLQQVRDDRFLDELPALDGGAAARAAIEDWLRRYGMRGVGEIDITRPRWRERPSMLVPMILGAVRNAEPGAAARRFEQGRREAQATERDILARLRSLPDGADKAERTKQMIDRVRTFIGYREYPKYGMVCRYDLYKQALMREADRLVEAHVLRERKDVHYLDFEELADAVRTHRVDLDAIDRRRADLRTWATLTPPRVLTSDGETLTGSHRRGDLPAGALAGTAVSAGTVEGRARVITDIDRADLRTGDILVTTYTDPSWTPLFLTAAGLVTEVGGAMTHGAVVAREYGLPAVVGVDGATRRIRDGQRIRLDGTAGHVELLD